MDGDAGFHTFQNVTKTLQGLLVFLLEIPTHWLLFQKSQEVQDFLVKLSLLATPLTRMIIQRENTGAQNSRNGPRLAAVRCWDPTHQQHGALLLVRPPPNSNVKFRWTLYLEKLSTGFPLCRGWCSAFVPPLAWRDGSKSSSLQDQRLEEFRQTIIMRHPLHCRWMVIGCTCCARQASVGPHSIFVAPTLKRPIFAKCVAVI